MAIFNTPITTDDGGLPRVLQQRLPILLYLYSRADPALDTALGDAARQQAGRLLVARVDTNRSPRTYSQYKSPVLPALMSIQNGDVQAISAPASSQDVTAHVRFLLGEGPKPAAKAAPSGTPGRPVPVSDSSFTRDVLQSPIPVLVDFWAPWCGPCHMVAPILDTLAQKYAGQVKIAKLNVDENPQSASTYQTRSIPTLILFKHGQLVERLVGAQPQAVIERLIQSASQR